MRITPSAHEAGVETLSEFRERGYATRTVADIVILVVGRDIVERHDLHVDVGREARFQRLQDGGRVRRSPQAARKPKQLEALIWRHIHLLGS